MTAALAGLPAAGFTLNAGETDMNAAIVSGGFDIKVTERASLGLQLNAELSQQRHPACRRRTSSVLILGRQADLRGGVLRVLVVEGV